MAPLENGVSNVRALSSQKKMFRADTIPNVASMKDSKLRGSRSICQFPREPVRENELPFASSARQAAVPGGARVSTPEPACRSLFDGRPEALFERGWLAECVWSSHELRLHQQGV